MRVKEFAKKYGVSERRVQKLLKENRIPGARKIYGGWLIPNDAVWPTDKRQSMFTRHWQDKTRKPISE